MCFLYRSQKAKPFLRNFEGDLQIQKTQKNLANIEAEIPKQMHYQQYYFVLTIKFSHHMVL